LERLITMYKVLNELVYSQLKEIGYYNFDGFILTYIASDFGVMFYLIYHLEQIMLG
jgi:hypothetical protein